MEVIENTYLERKISTSSSKLSPNTIKSTLTNEFNDLVKGFDTIHEKYIRLSNKLRTEMDYSHYEVSNFAKIPTSENHQ
jgi:hypothetical protein